MSTSGSDQETGPVPDDGREREPVPKDAAFVHAINHQVWVASGGGGAGPRKLYLAGHETGIDITPETMADLIPLVPDKSRNWGMRTMP